MWKSAMIGALLLVLQFPLNRGLVELDTPWVEPPMQKRFHLSPVLYEILSVGQLPAAIDWLWILMLQDRNLSKVRPGEHPVGFYYLELATELDPAFFEVYMHGSNWLAVIRDDIVGADRLLVKGEKFRTQDLRDYPRWFQRKYWGAGWVLPLQLAYVSLFEMDDMDRAAEMFLRAADQPGSPRYLEQLALRLQRPGGKYEVGLRLINFLIEGSQDNEVKRRLERRRNSLFLIRYLDDLNREFRNFVRDRLRSGEPRAVSPRKMRAYWREFRSQKKVPARDPFRGQIYLDKYGRIRTKTPMESVYGLGKEYL